MHPIRPYKQTFVTVVRGWISWFFYQDPWQLNWEHCFFQWTTGNMEEFKYLVLARERIISYCVSLQNWTAEIKFNPLKCKEFMISYLKYFPFNTGFISKQNIGKTKQFGCLLVSKPIISSSRWKQDQRLNFLYVSTFGRPFWDLIRLILLGFINDCDKHSVNLVPLPLALLIVHVGRR